MDSDDLEPKAKIINTDFDTLSISELELHILDPVSYTHLRAHET